MSFAAEERARIMAELPGRLRRIDASRADPA
jgi:hypothetical protein